MTKSKKAFGGFVLDFRYCEDSLEKVFGKEPVTPSEMTKKLWKYIKKEHLDTFED